MNLCIDQFNNLFQHCVFWQYQMEFYENLANKSYVLQGDSSKVRIKTTMKT